MVLQHQKFLFKYSLKSVLYKSFWKQIPVLSRLESLQASQTLICAVYLSQAPSDWIGSMWALVEPLELRQRLVLKPPQCCLMAICFAMLKGEPSPPHAISRISVFVCSRPALDPYPEKISHSVVLPTILH